MAGRWVSCGNGTMAFVSWSPRDPLLHYPQLFRGIYEYLRQPPELQYLDRARQYLAELLEYPNAPMQRDRIAWVRDWIAHVPPDERG